ncbi:MAG: COX15/CtaA family protein [Perlucidibaca sp.]
MARYDKRALVRWTRLALVLTLMVIMLGAWTRLRDAGLGCPDWPTCYGHLTVPSSPEALAKARELFPHQEVVARKAWPETIHRYFASSIGLVILVLAAWMVLRRREPGMPWRHGLLLFLLVCVQGAFGAFTVTEKLYPPVVTAHLIIGFSTLTTLFLLYLRLTGAFPRTGDWRIADLRRLVYVAIAVLALQILLGGWTASNYAAAVCTDLPVCQAGWQQAWSPAEAFRLFRPEDRSYEFAPHLGAAAKVTIHASHRMGAMLVTLALFILAVRLYLQAQSRRYRLFALVLVLALLVQVGLGIINVRLQLPLVNAVAHNVWAAVLLQILVALAYAMRRERS